MSMMLGVYILHLYLSVCVYKVCGFVKVRGQPLWSVVFLHCFTSLFDCFVIFCYYRVSLDPGTYPVREPRRSEQPWGLCPPSSTKAWVACWHTWLLHECLGYELRPPCFRSKDEACWALFSVPDTLNFKLSIILTKKDLFFTEKRRVLSFDQILKTLTDLHRACNGEHWKWPTYPTIRIDEITQYL